MANQFSYNQGGYGLLMLHEKVKGAEPITKYKQIVHNKESIPIPSGIIPELILISIPESCITARHFIPLRYMYSILPINMLRYNL